jgi:hypothetical protein
MATSNDIIKLTRGLSLSERLKIVEEILRGIREEEILREKEIKSKPKEKSAASPILAMAGIFDKEEAKVFEIAIAESRKIDEDEW